MEIIAVPSVLAALFALLYLRSGSQRHDSLANKFAVLSFLALTFFSLLLFYYVFGGNYSIEYVYQYTDSSLPWYYKISAMWAGIAGTWLLWAWFTYGAYFFARRFYGRLVSGIFLVFSAFFAIFAAMNDVFAPLTSEGILLYPSDGNGLLYVLQNRWMFFHPTVMFLAYTVSLIPLCAAISYYLGNRDWEKSAHSSILISWVLFGLSTLLGGLWAYEALGWGGYWAWDPVETAPLVCWLVWSAYLHGRRQYPQKWLFAIIIVGYLLTLFTTGIVRGIIPLPSVHAF